MSNDNKPPEGERDYSNCPRFAVRGKGTKNPKVIIQCSKCGKDIREMKMTEKLPIDRGYYCKDCDDGTIRLNMPTNGD